MAPIVRTQDYSSLAGPTVLGLQFTYNVGIGFPTLSSCETSFKEGLSPYCATFPLPYTLELVCSFSLLSPSSCPTPFLSFFPQFIALE